MEAAHTQTSLDAFFASVESAPRRALLLDYDGTLAPFRPQRDQAIPYPGVREILAALLAVRRTRVVIVSGRAVADLVQLLAINPLPELWGSHGWERRHSDGRYFPPECPPSAQEGLATAAQIAAARGLEHALEHKPAGMALHWRGLEPKTIAALREEIVQAWAPIVPRYSLKLVPFDGGLELRVPGRDKGTAVRTLLAELGSGTPLAYLGDDLTDEDAFRAIGTAGLRVLVRAEPRLTAADLRIRPPDDLVRFLLRWAQLDVPGYQL